MEGLKRVLVMDGRVDHYLMLTESQIGLLKFMVEHGLCHDDVTYSILDDQAWEAV